MTLAHVVVDVIREPDMSGANADRPGIDYVWVGIEARRSDLILDEEFMAAVE